MNYGLAFLLRHNGYYTHMYMSFLQMYVILQKLLKRNYGRRKRTSLLRQRRIQRNQAKRKRVMRKQTRKKPRKTALISNVVILYVHTPSLHYMWNCDVSTMCGCAFLCTTKIPGTPHLCQKLCLQVVAVRQPLTMIPLAVKYVTPTDILLSLTTATPNELAL